jgi:hypothetical protein
LSGCLANILSGPEKNFVRGTKNNRVPAALWQSFAGAACTSEDRCIVFIQRLFFLIAHAFSRLELLRRNMTLRHKVSGLSNPLL